MSAHDLIRFGPWQKALSGVRTVDAVICDPPYSDRTHAGQRSYIDKCPNQRVKNRILYPPIDQKGMRDFVRSWAPRTSWWFVVFGDHVSVHWALTALQDQDWYTFAPVIWIRTDAGPRYAGDGPTSSAQYIAIARRRRCLPSERVGSRPGWYRGPGVPYRERAGFDLVGSKPLWLMRALIEAYTRTGDQIADPFAGTGTTLVAARELGRRVIGAEQDERTHKLATERLGRAFQPSLFAPREPYVIPEEVH